MADINYGGSTGYGRKYRKRLAGSWGIVDVDDCSNAAKYLAGAGRVDPKRLCITGGSAGGYTTLACLAFRYSTQKCKPSGLKLDPIFYHPSPGPHFLIHEAYRTRTWAYILVP